MTLTCCQDHILTETIWFVWSETSYSGDKMRCYNAGQTNEQLKIELLSQWKLEAEFRNLLLPLQISSRMCFGSNATYMQLHPTFFFRLWLKYIYNPICSRWCPPTMPRTCFRHATDCHRMLLAVMMTTSRMIIMQIVVIDQTAALR